MTSSSSSRCPKHLHLLSSAKYKWRYRRSQVVPKKSRSNSKSRDRSRKRRSRSRLSDTHHIGSVLSITRRPSQYHSLIDRKSTIDSIDYTSTSHHSSHPNCTNYLFNHGQNRGTAKRGLCSRQEGRSEEGRSEEGRSEGRGRPECYSAAVDGIPGEYGGSVWQPRH